MTKKKRNTLFTTVTALILTKYCVAFENTLKNEFDKRWDQKFDDQFFDVKQLTEREKIMLVQLTHDIERFRDSIVWPQRDDANKNNLALVGINSKSSGHNEAKSENNVDDDFSGNGRKNNEINNYAKENINDWKEDWTEKEDWDWEDQNEVHWGAFKEDDVDFDNNINDIYYANEGKLTVYRDELNEGNFKNDTRKHFDNWDSLHLQSEQNFNDLNSSIIMRHLRIGILSNKGGRELRRNRRKSSARNANTRTRNRQERRDNMKKRKRANQRHNFPTAKGDQITYHNAYYTSANGKGGKKLKKVGGKETFTGYEKEYAGYKKGYGKGKKKEGYGGYFGAKKAKKKSKKGKGFIFSPVSSPATPPTLIFPTSKPSPPPTPDPTPGPTNARIPDRVTPDPTPTPTTRPTPDPTPRPTFVGETPSPNTPTPDPTSLPTPDPTPSPTPNPTPDPTPKPTPKTPTADPTPGPTPEDSVQPSEGPDSTSYPTPDGPFTRCFNDKSPGIGCPRPDLREVCDKYNQDASFEECFNECIDAFCCIHDSASTRAQSCSKEENCVFFDPCYIIWFKLHDTIGPAPFLRLEQNERFYENVETEAFKEVLSRRPDFKTQLFGHHFQSDDLPLTDETFLKQENWT
mmetsp:Transcript_36960/g.42159  ORF Transcript_36960/g.42159 Transcript_36960/m.42159 type:complete len:631 (-) Transcript_36960:464-2356(-)